MGKVQSIGWGILIGVASLLAVILAYLFVSAVGAEPLNGGRPDLEGFDQGSIVAPEEYRLSDGSRRLVYTPLPGDNMNVVIIIEADEPTLQGEVGVSIDKNTKEVWWAFRYTTHHDWMFGLRPIDLPNIYPDNYPEYDSDDPDGSNDGTDCDCKMS